MHIFKFGGASVNSANAIKNVAEIITKHQHTPLVIVVSAMGKMTNALEVLVNQYITNQPTHETLATIKEYHTAIVTELFSNATHPIHATLHNVFVTLEWSLMMHLPKITTTLTTK